MIKSLTDLPSIASYLARIGAEPRSLRTAIVKETRGKYWQDIATIRLLANGTIDAPEGYEPTESEAALIKSESNAAEWPSHMILPGRTYELPKELKGKDDKDIFEFKDRSGNLIMLQQRIDIKGEKKYIPWTYWSDNEWRKIEPEGSLSLWGMEQIKDVTTVFIHEGAKAARKMRDLINPSTAEEKARLAAHPWGQELQGAVHIGWIGGALSPARTDWTELAKAGVKRAYIVADNDAPGVRAVPAIAQRLNGITTFSIEFTDQFPGSFDLGDDFPAKMFRKIGDRTHYIGPSFRSSLHPATWATDQIPQPGGGQGRPITVLRNEFKELWSWIEESDLFVCKEIPEIMRQANTFNGMIAPFSHVVNTAQLVQKSYKGRTTRLCYRPDLKGRIVTDRTSSAINLHTETMIKSAQGDFRPWIEFLEYLFPIEMERKEVMRWCATLIARPEIRMLYGLLLISERQGMGKTTLGEKVLAPLVGVQNAGFPTEKDIVDSNFNSWIANKRLVVIGEIYTGQSWKAYNLLKAYITDKSISVNEKFMRPYTIENWAHVVACSNSKKALRIEETDRRWFYPSVSEEPWPEEKFNFFFDWLASGGLSIIRHWAENYGDYVKTGQHSPMTAAKAVLIHESKSDVVQDLMAFCEAMNKENKKAAYPIKWIRAWLTDRNRKMFESDLELRKVMKSCGFETYDERLTVDGLMQYVVVSPELFSDINKLDHSDRKGRVQLVRQALTRPGTESM